MELDPPPPVHADDRRRRCREYLLALEEERRKIQVFQRELPLCLDLVTQTIEGMRSHMDGVGSEETVSDHGGPVLEEFMPLKSSLSLSSCDDEHESAHNATAATTTPSAAAAVAGNKQDNKAATPDWLQSVQLWSQESHKELPCKPVALKARNAGGAFQPFDKEKKRAAEVPAPASSAVAGDSSCDKATDTEKHSSDNRETDKESKVDKGKKDKDKDQGQSQPTTSNRKPRRCWAPELHRRFLQALQQLGGSHVATPKQIRELMKVDGLTNDEVKSHLQKYRLHTRRPNSTVQSSNASSAAPPAQQQFVVVGGIWVPPPEYAAAAAAAAAAVAAAPPPPQAHNPAGDASASANTVYAPVATLPPGVKQGQRPSSRCSYGRRTDDAGDASSASPAVSSSSSQTTSA